MNVHRTCVYWEYFPWNTNTCSQLWTREKERKRKIYIYIYIRMYTYNHWSHLTIKYTKSACIFTYYTHRVVLPHMSRAPKVDTTIHLNHTKYTRKKSKSSRHTPYARENKIARLFKEPRQKLFKKNTVERAREEVKHRAYKWCSHQTFSRAYISYLYYNIHTTTIQKKEIYSIEKNKQTQWQAQKQTIQIFSSTVCKPNFDKTIIETLGE